MTAAVALATLGAAAPFAAASPPTPQQAQPAPRPKPIKAKIVNAQSSGNNTELIVAVDAGHPVQTGWRGQLVDASGQPVAGGAFTVHTVRKRQVVGTVVGLSPQAVIKTTAVLSPP